LITLKNHPTPNPSPCQGEECCRRGGAFRELWESSGHDITRANNFHNSNRIAIVKSPENEKLMMGKSFENHDYLASFSLIKRVM
jgi:hypothetical protein